MTEELAQDTMSNKAQTTNRMALSIATSPWML
jgi:hypothetical protein